MSAFIGVGVGTLCGLWRLGEWLLIPVFIVLQAAPVAAFIPLVTFIYGIGMTAKTLAVIILALPVIVLNTYVLAELLITPTGIGDLITYSRSLADYAAMYATIASIIALSTLTLVALQWVETRVFRPEKRGK